MRTRKYNYYKVIQQNYGYGHGYEDASLYECDSMGYMPKEERSVLNHDLKEYKLLGYPTRVIRRREPVTTTNP